MSDANTVSYESVDGIGLIRFDDGKVNAMSYTAIAKLDDAVATALRDDRALVFAGRPGVFSGGFDLGEVSRGPDEAAAIIHEGGRLLRRIFESPRPTVAACTGHAVAGGAVLLLISDYRVGARGDYRIGLNEALIGIGLPEFVVRVGQYRLDRTVCERLLLGELCDPTQAVAAGYLDVAVPADSVIDRAFTVARDLASRDPRAYAVTKACARKGLGDAGWRPQ